MGQELLFDISQGIALITINRPETHNSLSAGIIEGIGAAYRRCDEDDRVRAVVLTCPLSTQAWDVRKPVIAACNGHAVGAGMGLAMQADMRVFADEGKYGFLQCRRGVVTDFAMEYVLPRLVGFERAFELLVRAPRLTGQEAVAWGLAARSLPAGQVLETAMEIAGDIATNCAPLAAGLHKHLLWRGLDLPLPELAALESRALNHTMARPDAVEGGRAYFERRQAEWTGSVPEDWPEWLPTDPIAGG